MGWWGTCKGYGKEAWVLRVGALGWKTTSEAMPGLQTNLET